eukprot:4812308-Alexandrium_andersonii.AAC.1
MMGVAAVWRRQGRRPEAEPHARAGAQGPGHDPESADQEGRPQGPSRESSEPQGPRAGLRVA